MTTYIVNRFKKTSPSTVRVQVTGAVEIRPGEFIPPGSAQCQRRYPHPPHPSHHGPRAASARIDARGDGLSVQG